MESKELSIRGKMVCS